MVKALDSASSLSKMVLIIWNTVQKAQDFEVPCTNLEFRLFFGKLEESLPRYTPRASLKPLCSGDQEPSLPCHATAQGPLFLPWSKLVQKSWHHQYYNQHHLLPFVLFAVVRDNAVPGKRLLTGFDWFEHLDDPRELFLLSSSTQPFRFALRDKDRQLVWQTF